MFFYNFLGPGTLLKGVNLEGIGDRDLVSGEGAESLFMLGVGRRSRGWGRASLMVQYLLEPVSGILSMPLVY